MSITKRALFGEIKIPKPSEEEARKFNLLQSHHEQLNDLFIDEFFEEWNSKFLGMTIPQIHESFKYKGYAKSKYNKLSAELGGKLELLKFLLVANKFHALKHMGYNSDQIKKLLVPFGECGRYMVAYKNSSLKFSTIFPSY